MATDKPLELPLAAIGALELGQKLDAIKIVRQELKLDLLSAKNLVESYQQQHPPSETQVYVVDDIAPVWFWLGIVTIMMALGGIALLQS